MSEVGEKRIVVLCVEDDQTNRTLMSTIFQRHLPHLALVLAASGHDAIEMGREQDVDLLLLDANLGDMTGREVFDELRAVRPALPVVVISGAPLADQWSTDVAQMSYLSKPYRVQELLAAVNNALA